MPGPARPIMPKGGFVEFKTLHLEIEGVRATLRFNRPAHYNALNELMSRELLQALQVVQEQESLRVLVLKGQGKAFHAGGDVKAFREAEAGISGYVRRTVTDFHAFINELIRLPLPVVCAVNGVAAGAGFSIAMAGDVVIASTAARFTVAYSKLGASPDGGLSHFLVRLVGVRRAMDLYLSNRILNAAEALELGLVSRVVPADDFEAEVEAAVESLAQGPTLAYAKAKQLFYQSHDHPLDTQLNREGERIVASTGTDDFLEGIRAFQEKRAPSFKGR